MEPDVTDPKTAVRAADGTFLAGNSAGGRTKGSKNRVTALRLEIEEAVRLQLASAAQSIMAKAIQLAQMGDTDMLKVFLDKMLASPKDAPDEEVRPSDIKIVIVGPDSAPRLTIMPPSSLPVIDVFPEPTETK